MKRTATAYWVTTIVIALVLLGGGAANLVRRPEVVENLTRLGYPVYLTSILGLWKVLGALVILAPGLPRLKEWAYSGAIFNLTGAAISHAVAGHPAGDIFWPLAFAACAMASWGLRPAGRRLA